MPTQLLAFAALYLLGGVGCLVFAQIRVAPRPLLEFFVIPLLWPLYAPFILAGASDASEEFHSPLQERELLEQRFQRGLLRLSEIDGLLKTADWDRGNLMAELGKTTQGSAVAREALQHRIEHVDRLTLVRKVTAEELEVVRGLLEQLKAQTELSRFLESKDLDRGLQLDEARERIARTEATLATETELLTL